MSAATRTREPKRRIGYEARRRLVLQAALDTFAEVGFRAATMDEIARRAGVTKAVVYDHFPSKHALHLALLERERDALLEHVRAHLDGPGATAGVAAALDAFYVWVEEHPAAWMLLSHEDDPDVAEARAQAHLAVVEGLLPSGGDPAVRQAIAAAVGGATHAVARWWRHHPEVPREQVVATVMDVLWRGLERTARDAR